MAYQRIATNAQTWTLLAGPVSSITFQNATGFPVYLNFTTNATAPTDTVGLAYGPWLGEMKKGLADMTLMEGPTHVWAKSASTSGSIIVETA